VLRSVLAAVALAVCAVAVWRVLATSRRGSPSGRWFVVLLVSGLVAAVGLLW
jgi:hypothetical protein